MAQKVHHGCGPCLAVDHSATCVNVHVLQPIQLVATATNFSEIPQRRREWARSEGCCRFSCPALG